MAATLFSDHSALPDPGLSGRAANSRGVALAGGMPLGIGSGPSGLAANNADFRSPGVSSTGMGGLATSAFTLTDQWDNTAFLGLLIQKAMEIREPILRVVRLLDNQIRVAFSTFRAEPGLFEQIGWHGRPRAIVSRKDTHEAVLGFWGKAIRVDERNVATPEGQAQLLEQLRALTDSLRETMIQEQVARILGDAHHYFKRFLRDPDVLQAATVLGAVGRQKATFAALIKNPRLGFANLVRLYGQPMIEVARERPNTVIISEGVLGVGLADEEAANVGTVGGEAAAAATKRGETVMEKATQGVSIYKVPTYAPYPQQGMTTGDTDHDQLLHPVILKDFFRLWVDEGTTPDGRRTVMDAGNDVMGEVSLHDAIRNDVRYSHTTEEGGLNRRALQDFLNDLHVVSGQIDGAPASGTPDMDVYPLDLNRAPAGMSAHDVMVRHKAHLSGGRGLDGADYGICLVFGQRVPDALPGAWLDAFGVAFEKYICTQCDATTGRSIADGLELMRSLYEVPQEGRAGAENFMADRVDAGEMNRSASRANVALTGVPSLDGAGGIPWGYGTVAGMLEIARVARLGNEGLPASVRATATAFVTALRQLYKVAARTFPPGTNVFTSEKACPEWWRTGEVGHDRLLAFGLLLDGHKNPIFRNQAVAGDIAGGGLPAAVDAMLPGLNGDDDGSQELAELARHIGGRAPDVFLNVGGMREFLRLWDEGAARMGAFYERNHPDADGVDNTFVHFLNTYILEDDGTVRTDLGDDPPIKKAAALLHHVVERAFVGIVPPGGEERLSVMEQGVPVEQTVAYMGPTYLTLLSVSSDHAAAPQNGQEVLPLAQPADPFLATERAQAADTTAVMVPLSVHPSFWRPLGGDEAHQFTPADPANPNRPYLSTSGDEIALDDDEEVDSVPQRLRLARTFAAAMAGARESRDAGLAEWAADFEDEAAARGGNPLGGHAAELHPHGHTLQPSFLQNAALHERMVRAAGAATPLQGAGIGLLCLARNSAGTIRRLMECRLPPPIDAIGIRPRIQYFMGSGVLVQRSDKYGLQFLSSFRFDEGNDKGARTKFFTTTVVFGSHILNGNLSSLMQAITVAPDKAYRGGETLKPIAPTYGRGRRSRLADLDAAASVIWACLPPTEAKGLPQQISCTGSWNGTPLEAYPNITGQDSNLHYSTALITNWAHELGEDLRLQTDRLTREGGSTALTAQADVDSPMAVVAHIAFQGEQNRINPRTFGQEPEIANTGMWGNISGTGAMKIRQGQAPAPQPVSVQGTM